jgi:hypothetical protein
MHADLTLHEIEDVVLRSLAITQASLYDPIPVTCAELRKLEAHQGSLGVTAMRRALNWDDILLVYAMPVSLTAANTMEFIFTSATLVQIRKRTGRL